MDHKSPGMMFGYPSAEELFKERETDPVLFLMDYWGESREDAERLVEITKQVCDFGRD